MDSGPWLGNHSHQLLQADHWLVSKDAGSPCVLGGSHASADISTTPSSMPTSRSTHPEDLIPPLPQPPGMITDTSPQSQQGTGDLLRMFSKTTSSLLKGQSFCDVETTSADLWYYRPRSCSSCPGPLITEPSAMVSLRCLCFLFLDLSTSYPILFVFLLELLFPS